MVKVIKYVMFLGMIIVFVLTIIRLDHDKNNSALNQYIGDYSCVYNTDYYKNKYNDFYVNDFVRFSNFQNVGMELGQQASEEFNVYAYMCRYSDLRVDYGDNYLNYYNHYIKYGKKEGRVAVANYIYDNIDYSSVFDYDYYVTHYDIPNEYKNDNINVFRYFVQQGIGMGQQGSAGFSAKKYLEDNPKLKTIYGEDWGRVYIDFLK